jgi:predicted transcriptional regulator
MDEAKRLIAFRCDHSAAGQLEALARKGDRSLSAEIRRAVREHVAKCAGDPRGEVERVAEVERR